LISLDNIDLVYTISTVSIKSQPSQFLIEKFSIFKNLYRECLKGCLDSRENLDTYKKVFSAVETPRLTIKSVSFWIAFRGKKTFFYFCRLTWKQLEYQSVFTTSKYELICKQFNSTINWRNPNPTYPYFMTKLTYIDEQSISNSFEGVHGVVKKSGSGSSIFVFYCIFILQFLKVF
jgi:hypothetical protein